VRRACNCAERAQRRGFQAIASTSISSPGTSNSFTITTELAGGCAAKMRLRTAAKPP
jgi:hypothetical protein